MEYILSFLFTEHPNCELLSYGFQRLNLFSTLFFLLPIYDLALKKRYILAFLVFIAFLGSLTHHLVPIDETVLFDVLPAAILGIVFLYLALKNLNQADWIKLAILAGVALLSLLLDARICSVILFGTHFLWHISSALVLYLIAKRI